MSHASLTRRIRFTAQHRFWRQEWSAAENAAAFGASADVNYHGHTYFCDVTVRGRIDPRTGTVVDLGVLDRTLAREIRDRFDGRTLNVDVAEFADGGLVPSGENLARFIFDRVRATLTSDVQVVEVTVAEDDTLRSCYRGD